MASSPVHSASHRGVFNYTRVVMNTSLISAPVPAPLNENLLNREVFDYDFSRERVFLEIAHAELEAMKEAEQKASAASSSAARASTSSAVSDAGRGSSESGKDFEDDLARHVGASLSVSGSGRSLTSRPRTTSDDDVAAAISASLREY